MWMLAFIPCLLAWYPDTAAVSLSIGLVHDIMIWSLLALASDCRHDDQTIVSLSISLLVYQDLATASFGTSSLAQYRDLASISFSLAPDC